MKRYVMDTSACACGHCGPVEDPSGEYYSRADLIAAGVLVPVPDGEAVAIMDCDSKYFAHGGHVYEIPDGEFYGVLLGHEGPHYTGFYGDSATIVQPVCLVPLEDVG